MIALLYLISLGVFFIFLVVATIAVIASSIKKKKKAKKAKKQSDYDNDEEQGYEDGYEKLDKAAAIQAVNSRVDDDIFAEAVLEATQIADETAAQVAQPQPVMQPQAPVQQEQPVMQPQAPVQQEQPVMQPQTPVQPIQPDMMAQPQPVMQPQAPVQQEQSVVQQMTSVQPEQSVVQPMQPDMMVQPVAPAEDSAFADSAFVEDSAFGDSAFAEDSAFTDSAFGDSAFNNPDGNAFPGSAFENPTLVDPSAMTAATVNYTHGGQGQDPVGNFYWFNKEDVADRPDYKPEEMFYRHFTTANECIEDLLIEMYDCALVRTEDIRYIAYGIEPRHVAMRDVAATGNAAYNAAKKRKEPTKEDMDKIYRKWCSYVDKLFEIVEFRADNTTIGIIRDKLYEFGKSDVDTLIEGK